VPPGNLSDWGVAAGGAVFKFQAADADAAAFQEAKNTDAVENHALKFVGKTINTVFDWQNL
jgi:hypothetical protein